MKFVYLVQYDTSLNEPNPVVSIWTTREGADQEADRLNKLEDKYQQRLGKYVVEEVATNTPGTVPLN